MKPLMCASDKACNVCGMEGCSDHCQRCGQLVSVDFLAYSTTGPTYRASCGCPEDYEESYETHYNAPKGWSGNLGDLLK